MLEPATLNDAPALLAELLAARRFPPMAQLTRLERLLERGWWACWRWGWIILAAVALATAGAVWLGPLEPATKTSLTLIALADVTAWHASLLVVTAQMASHVVVPTVRNAHEVHDFVHAQRMAKRIAAYAAADVDQVGMWLKYRAELIMSRARFVLGGEAALGAILAALQSSTLQNYLSKGATLLAPVYHVPVDRMATGLFAGVVIFILQVLMVMTIASGYTRLLRFVELSKSFRPSLTETYEGGSSALENSL